MGMSDHVNSLTKVTLVYLNLYPKQESGFLVFPLAVVYIYVAYIHNYIYTHTDLFKSNAALFTVKVLILHLFIPSPLDPVCIMF